MNNYFHSIEKIPSDVIIRLNNAVKDGKIKEYIKVDPETYAPYIEFEGYEFEILLTKTE